MADTIIAGTIRVQEDTQLPGSLLHAGSDSNGWAMVDGTSSAFEKALQDAGWTFFFMAGEIKTTVFGFDREKAMGTALGRLIAGVKAQNYNGIEITKVTGSSFLGMPYVSVCAHPRHL